MKTENGVFSKLKSLLASDSARVKDVNGYLNVANCNISKAAVNPYYGRDIPNWQELGLIPDKIYMMLRDPDELAKAASTFNGKPLLRGHHDIHAGDIPKEMIIGSTGTDSHFNYPFLIVSTAVWDEQDIELIEFDKVKELSSSYFYRADMTAGEFEGVHYDGVMRDIVGNHVAVVERGRAGSQVAVADSDIIINEKETKNMALIDVIKSKLGLASDAQDEEIIKTVEAMQAKDSEDDNQDKPKADDEENEKAEDESDDEVSKLKQELAAKDREIEDLKSNAKSTDEDDTKKANDTAMIRSQVITEMRGVAKAQAAVRPFVGELAMDSADDIYKAGLKHLGVDISALPTSALQATFEAVSKASRSAKANDSAIQINNSLADAMNLKHF